MNIKCSECSKEYGEDRHLHLNDVCLCCIENLKRQALRLDELTKDLQKALQLFDSHEYIHQKMFQIKKELMGTKEEYKKYMDNNLESRISAAFFRIVAMDIMQGVFGNAKHYEVSDKEDTGGNEG